MRHLASAVAFGVLTGAVALLAQAPTKNSPAQPVANAVIRGRILAEGTDTPLRNARVEITANPGTAAPAFTDADGAFVVLAPRPGQYRLSVNKAGYATGTLSARTSDDAGTLGTAADSRSATPVELRLPKAAAISGRIIDTLGDPVAGMTVMAEMASSGQSGQGGQPRSNVVAKVQTNELGDYRLGGLPAGTFFIVGAMSGFRISSVAGGAGGNVVTMNTMVSVSGTETPRSYFPGVPDVSQAQPIVVQSGEEARSIDFAVQQTRVPMPTLRRTQPAYLQAVPTCSVNNSCLGAIRGRLTSPNGDPIRQAVVQLLADDDLSPAGAVTSDDEGRYEFLKLPSGYYRVVASKPGYVTSHFGQGQSSTAGEPVGLRPGEARDRADIVLPRTGTITGRLLDEAGEPVEGTSVRVLRIGYEAGQRRLVNVTGIGLQPTDDTGRYRIEGLEAGQYIIGTLTSLPGYAPTYLPGSTNPGDAQLVSVELSQQVTDADFSLSPVRTARISGTALDAMGQAVWEGVTLRRSRRSETLDAVSMVTSVRSSDGTFEFLNVPTGEYVLQVNTTMVPPVQPSGSSLISSSSRLPRSRTGGSEFATMFVTVNGTDVTDLAVRTSLGSTAAGRITLEEQAEASFETDFDIAAVPVDLDRTPRNRASIAGVLRNRTFGMDGLVGPHVFRLIRAPRDWALKAVLLNGMDISDRPIDFGRSDQSLNDIEVVLTNHVSDVSGRVTDRRGRGIAGAAIVIFPTNRDLWTPTSRFLATTRTERSGSFSIRGLPAGDYSVVAVDNLAPGEWQDPDFLSAMFPEATPVTLLDGDNVSINPRLVTR